MARTVLETAGEDVGVFGGEFDVYGTTSGGEEITILSGTDVWLDPSFNTGGDTIRLPGEAEEYTAYVSGSYVILESTVNDVTVEIPIGPNGITIVFGGDDSRVLRYDSTDARVELDGEPIDGTADPLSPGDDTPPPPPTTYTVLGSSPTVTEGDSGTRLLTYTITLDQPAEEDVTITYTTLASGSAEMNDDFQPVTGTVTIPAGSTTAFVSVPVFGDTAIEGNETVDLQLSGADLEATQVLSGTIIDDDAAPPPPAEYELSINSPTVTETDSGTIGLTYTVTLDRAAEEDVVVTYTTTGGTASPNDDYTPVTGTVVIPAGSATAFITVPVIGDTEVEGNETVELTVDSANADPVVGVGTIVNDDQFQTEFNLQEGSETIIGTPEPDTFRASNNELGSGDYIDGRESTDTLILGIDQDAVNFFDYFGGDLADGDIDYRGFETDNLEQFLVTNDSDYDVTLDMSGTEGVTLVGSVNSSSDVRFEHVEETADVLVEDITYSDGTDVEVYYRDDEMDGTSDTVVVTVINSDLDDIELGTIDNFGGTNNDGIENVNLIVQNPGDSSFIDDLDTQLTNLDISGTGDLVIDNSLEETVRTIDATGLAGDLDIDFSDNDFDEGVVFDGAQGDNTVEAGDGDDDIETQGGADYVNARGGDDTIDTNAGDDTVYAGNGDDDVDLGSGTNWTSLGDGNDFVTATNADGSLASGNNIAWAGTGDDTVVFGAGDDGVYIHDGGYENVSLDGGDDFVWAGAAFAGDDSAALSGRQDDILAFGTGTDWLYVDAGTTDLDYQNTTGLEILVLTTAGVTVLGDEAEDAGINTVYGNSGDDDIDATAFDTTGLTILPSTGNDNIRTGSANDEFIFYTGELNNADILFDANGGNEDELTLNGSTTLTNAAIVDDFEIVNLNNTGVGDDDYTIFTDGGWVSTADGVLTVNAGGLGSNDDVYFDAWSSGNADYAVHITTGAGNDYIDPSSGDYDDCINSGAGDDFMYGNDGDDDIYAAEGNDILNGGFGDDDLHGGSGDDVLNGDDGADRLVGGLGADTINTGGMDGDFDQILYATLDESANRPDMGRDTINDFVSGEDQIDISELLANNGISSGSTEFITAQDLDAAEAQMVSGDGVYSIVFIENLPGEPTDAIDDGTGFFFVDLNDDGELGGEDLQVFINGDNVTAGDVDTTLNLSGQSDYDLFIAEHCAYA